MRTLLLLICLTIPASAGTDCTTRKSGSVTITTCTDSGHKSNFQQCRSYMSGSVRKTTCRS
jgi:hypothetical protein